MIEFDASLAAGLAITGKITESRSLLDSSLEQVAGNGEAIYLPELLRLKGILLAKSATGTNQAESCFSQSLEISRKQGSLVWELRTATDWARLLIEKGRRTEADTLLKPIVEKFEGCPMTSDLETAHKLLN